jgi:ferrous iron transport protein A
MTLAQMKPGQKARIVKAPDSNGLGGRLIEFGFVANALLEILAEAPFGGDPILVRIHGTRMAIRRDDASSILVALLET